MNQWTYYCKGNTFIPILVAIDRHIQSESTTRGAIDSSKSYVEARKHGLRHEVDRNEWSVPLSSTLRTK